MAIHLLVTPGACSGKHQQRRKDGGNFILKACHLGQGEQGARLSTQLKYVSFAKTEYINKVGGT
ncbi:hypothetical protein DQQ10_05690 [Pseudochryseolinea flava]|uniref:Uncharacterized protein n=1 Tax=Pseudochryseolinea flava TaxID=2059302 RepID=A0A364Y5G3_9BACT|nr:hypothetical protein DQQ10_05690 [Pseudochryseolinea flava]